MKNSWSHLIAGVGDFNGDGKADMLLQWSDGTLQTRVGSGSGAIQSPMEKQWWDAFIGAQQLMAEMTTLAINAAAQAGHNIPTPQVDTSRSGVAACSVV